MRKKKKTKNHPPTPRQRLSLPAPSFSLLHAVPRTRNPDEITKTGDSNQKRKKLLFFFFFFYVNLADTDRSFA